MVRSTKFPGKVYKFKHDEDFIYQSKIMDVIFDKENAYLRIEPEGKIIIRGSKQSVGKDGKLIFRNGKPLIGYAWNGCSPKINFLDITWGTPDGKMNFDSEKPKTYFASMVHDALYQYKKEVGIRRIDADRIFLQIAREEKFLLSRIYYFFIRVFGRFCGKWNTKQLMSENVGK